MEAVQSQRLQRTHSRRTLDSAKKLDEEESKHESALDFFRPRILLTQKMMDEVNKALYGGPQLKTLVEDFNLTLLRNDIQTLGDGAWLNDQVVNFYFCLLMNRSKECAPKIYAFNTFFYPRLLKGGHQELAQWTRKVDLFAFDMIMVPLHLGMHWCLAVIDVRTETITSYDSLMGSNNQCTNALREYIAAEHIAKRQFPIDLKKWKLVIKTDIPTQKNNSDCGIFMRKFADYVSQDKAIDFDQGSMSYFRRRMVWEIINKTLL